MDKNEYLVARVGKVFLGAYCRDVENVYSTDVKLVKVYDDDSIFSGLTCLNGKVMQVLDLRKRIGMPTVSETEKLTLVTFNTGAKNSIAVVVDQIVGMQRLDDESIVRNEKIYDQREKNIGLLFPTIAKVKKGLGGNSLGLIHLIDSTYLEKTEPLIEDSGELELF